MQLTKDPTALPPLVRPHGARTAPHGVPARAASPSAGVASAPRSRSGTRLRPVSARIAVKQRQHHRLVALEPLVAWALAATAVVLASLIAST